jgi:hypothetical protein
MPDDIRDRLAAIGSRIEDLSTEVRGATAVSEQDRKRCSKVGVILSLSARSLREYIASRWDSSGTLLGGSNGFSRRPPLIAEGLVHARTSAVRKQILARLVMGDDPPDRKLILLLTVYSMVADQVKREISEALGELAGLRFLRGLSGGADLLAIPGDNVAPSDVQLDAGKPWDAIYVMSGNNTVNMLWWDGAELHVVECKGGDSQLGYAEAIGIPKPDPVKPGQQTRSARQQGTKGYLVDLAKRMRRKQSPPGKRAIGKALQSALEKDRVRSYVARCGPRKTLHNPPDPLDVLFSEEQVEGDAWNAKPVGQHKVGIGREARWGNL